MIVMEDLRIYESASLVRKKAYFTLPSNSSVFIATLHSFRLNFLI